MTRITELTPLLKRLQLGPVAATLPERIALARREQLDYASFWRSSSATRSTAAPTDALNSGCRAPVSRRPVAWRTSTGRRRLPWTAACWTPFSRWSFWTSTSTSSWWDRLASGRASWPRPWATRPFAPATPSASATPMTSSRPWLRPEWTTHWTVLSGPSSPPTCSSSTTSVCTGSPHNNPPISTN